jgi:HSP20 family protein
MLVGADPFLAEFDRLAHQVFGAGLAADGAGMPVDVTRRGEELVARFDIPGVSSEAITLSLENHVLTVSAQRHAEYGEGEKVLVQERFDGAMTRRLRVPEWVDAERVSADYADGVLTVVLPVAEQAKPRRIEIKATPMPTSSQQQIA